MYDKFYRFTGMPFLLTPDSRFFFGSSGHSRAMAHLVYGLSQEEGFIVITGEVGAGKTTLVEQLCAQLDRRSYTIARVVTTRVSGDDLLRLVMGHFGFGETQGLDKATLLHRFEQMVADQRGMGRYLLIVDEVQNLSVAALEELRMLSNVTVHGRASLQTILLGQPQFRPILASPDLEQLRQRVLASYHLGPLSERETRSYIEHRLNTVGWNDDPHWDDAAFIQMFRETDGIPRRINTLCSRVLLYSALEEEHTITRATIERTARELNQDLGAGLATTPPPATGQDAAPPDQAALARRVAALEQTTARQQRVFSRLLDLLSSGAEASR